MLTRRCTQRQFLLRPDPVTNDTFLYCLAIAALRYRITVLLSVVLSNHHHTIVHDPDGRIVEFTEYLHKLVARAVNAHRGRWENLWSSEPPCVVRLVDPADVIEKLAYAATNPVKDGLVERVHQWPGVHTLRSLLLGVAITVKRPGHFFRANGPLPPTATLTCEIPAVLGDATAILEALRARIKEIEARCRAERGGRPVLGRRAVRAQHWAERPDSAEPRRGLRPTIAARSVWSRVEALLRRRMFVDAYRAARALWVAGLPAVFPAGTYWLRRFAGVTVAGVPPAAA